MLDKFEHFNLVIKIHPQVNCTQFHGNPSHNQDITDNDLSRAVMLSWLTNYTYLDN